MKQPQPGCFGAIPGIILFIFLFRRLFILCIYEQVEKREQHVEVGSPSNSGPQA